jgi:hypothetical protein
MPKVTDYSSQSNNNLHPITNNSNRWHRIRIQVHSPHSSPRRSQTTTSFCKCQTSLKATKIEIRLSIQTSRCLAKTTLLQMCKSRWGNQGLPSTYRANSTSWTKTIWLSRSQLGSSSRWASWWPRLTTIRLRISWKSRQKIHTTRWRFVQLFKPFHGGSQKSHLKFVGKICTHTSILIFWSWKSKSQTQSSISLSLTQARWGSKSSLSSSSMPLHRSTSAGATCCKEKTS